MFEIGAVVGPRCQHHHRRIGHPLGRHRPQFFQQQVRVMLHRRHLVFGEQLREEAHHHLAVFQHVRHAGRHAQVVLQHVELAFAGPHDVDPGDVRVDAARHIDTLHDRPILRVVQHLLGRDDARLEYFLIVVDIPQEHVECLDPLAQSGLQGFPFGGRNHARNDVERDQALLARLLPIHGKGDPHPVKGQVGLGPLALDTLHRRCLEPVCIALVMGSDAACGVIHLVIEVHVGTRR